MLDLVGILHTGIFPLQVVESMFQLDPLDPQLQVDESMYQLDPSSNIPYEL